MEMSIPRDDYYRTRDDIEYINKIGTREEMETLFRRLVNKYGDCSDVRMLHSYSSWNVM